MTSDLILLWLVETRTLVTWAAHGFQEYNKMENLAVSASQRWNQTTHMENTKISFSVVVVDDACLLAPWEIFKNDSKGLLVKRTYYSDVILLEACKPIIILFHYENSYLKSAMLFY